MNSAGTADAAHPLTPKEIHMLTANNPDSAAPRHVAAKRLAGVAGAITAAMAVWLIARYGAGIQLSQPGFGSAHRPGTLTPVMVVVTSTVAALAAWGTTKLIEHTARRPRRAWLTTGLLALLVSLSAPLSGHGVTAAERLALIGMHLAVGAVLIPVLALSIQPRHRSAGVRTMRQRAGDTHDQKATNLKEATTMNTATRRIGTIGTVSRVIVGLGLLYLAFTHGPLAWNLTWYDAVLGLIALPAVMVVAGLAAHRLAGRAVRFTGPLGVAVNCAVILALVSNRYTAGGAEFFYGITLLVAAWRAQPGCEATVMSNLILGRDDQIGCPAFTPIDALEARRNRQFAPAPASQA